MAKKRVKVDSRLERLILKEKKSKPHIGIREISRLIKAKYKIEVSKSTIDNILRKKGTLLKRGRKKAILSYKRKEIADCGLLLLRCIDSKVGLFSVLAEKLRIYFPQLSKNSLEKIITLFSLSAYQGLTIKESIKRNGFLRIADLYSFPSRKITYFLNRLSEFKPSIELDQAKENTKKVSAVKLYFENGTASHSDGRLSTLWDGPCLIDDFSSTLLYTRKRLEEMIKQKNIILNYTKSFDYLSVSVLEFIQGLESGIKRIEVLDPKAKLLYDIRLKDFKPSFFIGYYPKIVSKGLKFLERAKRFKNVRAHEGTMLYTSLATEFSQPKKKQGLILHNVLLKKKLRSLPCWGVLTNRKKNIDKFLTKYLLLWPYMDKVFLDEMEKIEKSYLKTYKKKDLIDFVPATISFESERDFFSVGEILQSIFKEEFGTLSLKGKMGSITQGKESINIIIRDSPLKLKNKFNNACLYLNNKRIFIK